MTLSTAWQAIRVAYRCSAELQILLHELKQSCPADEYRDFARAIAASIHTLNVELVERALAAHPELRRRLEDDLAQFGRLSD